MKTPLILAACLLWSSVAHATRPNVVVIVSDDAGYADWGFMDAYLQTLNPGQAPSPVPTPNLDTLRERGVLFTNAYTASVCSPSRAAILTGSYQNRIGYEYNINNLTGADAVDGLAPEVVTIFERMKASGYTTGAIGKWHVGARDNASGLGNRPEHQGVDEFFGIWKGSRNYTVGGVHDSGTLRETIASPFSDTVLENTAPWDTTYNYVTNAFGKGAVDFIGRHYADPDPFFLYVAFTAPHAPIGPSPDINDPRIASLSGTRKEYASMVLTMDKEIGNILDKIDDPVGDGSVSLTDDTLVIFINDNGGASGIGTVNTPLNGFKGSTFEGGNRVPMLIAGPGVPSNPSAPVEYAKPVHSVDILPTCFEAAENPPLDGIDGVNLIPHFDGSTTGDPHEVITIRGGGNVGVRKGDWKLTKSGGAASFSLYDLASDIGETTNMSAAHPLVVDELLRDFTDFEAGSDKPRHAGLGNPADSINVNDRFMLDPASVLPSSFTPNLLLIGGSTLNGDFNAGGGSGAQTFEQTSSWTNIGNSSQTDNATQTNLDLNGTRNAIIAESAVRVFGSDTGHTLATGERFRVTYDWRSASYWDIANSRIRVALFTTDDDTITGTRSDIQALDSDLAAVAGTPQSEESIFDPVPASADGKRLFLAVDGADVGGGGFARLDNLVLERGSVTTGAATSELEWSDNGVWRDGDTNAVDTLLRSDAFAGAVLEFPVTDDFSYVATNDMTRPTDLEFMLNRIELTGDFGGSSPRSGVIDGNQLLFTNDLVDNAPEIRLAAGGTDFGFVIDNDIILYDDLILTGSGNAGAELSGAIRDYYEPSGIIKDGSSTFLLSGTPVHSGTTRILRGTLLIDDGTTLASSPVEIDFGGTLGGNGTVAQSVSGEGAIAPGESIGILTIDGDAAPGSIRMEIDGNASDLLVVGGELDLSDTNLSVTAGTGGITEPAYIIASYGTLTGNFSSFTNLPDGYVIDYTYNDGESSGNVALVTGTAPAPTRVLIDHDDGLANGIHDVAVLNGGFESNDGPAGASLDFSGVADWVSGNGSDQTAVRDNLSASANGPWNAVIDEYHGRVPTLDTRYIVAADSVFSLSFDWRDASLWSLEFDRIQATLYTTTNDLLGGPVAEAVTTLSSASLIAGTYQREATTLSLPASAAGKRLFLSLTGLDGNGATGGFARLDKVFLGVTTASPPTPYQAWVTATPSSGAAAFSGDANLDGVANGIAFFLGAPDPSAPALDLLPTASLTENDLQFTFTRADIAAGSSFVVEYGTDLDQWFDAIDGTDGVGIETDGGSPLDTITVTIPRSLAPGGSMFTRLRVEE